jgi:hypothetical protein
VTEPTGWTEHADTGYNNPTSGMEVASRDSGFTSTSIIWGSNSASNWGAIIAELDSSAAGGRASKNTRSAPLGVNVGMGWRMPV